MEPLLGTTKRRESTELEDLTDELLIEILRRLPTAKSAVGLKLVSKRWSSLISTPCFRSQFITHHININNNNQYHAIYQFTTRSAAFVTHRYPLRNSEDIKLFFITDKEDQIFESPEFTLGFLPEEREFVSVLATCNDLMLCRAWKERFVPNYYICNPFTQKWLLLPPPPISVSRDDNRFGLVYEPNYQRWIQGIKECRFRVAYIKNSETYGLCMRMYVYCSETRQWNEFPQLGTEYYVLGSIIAHYGRLNWYNGEDVVAYDPFNNEIFFLELFDSQAIVFDGWSSSSRFCLGICQGFLQVIRLVKSTDKNADYLCVWELEDPEDRSLSLKNKIFFGIGSSLDQYSLCLLHPVAFHPSHEDVVYLQLRDINQDLITCKIQRGKLEVVGESLYAMMWYFAIIDIFTIVIPWWPTPVPMLPQTAHV